MNPVNMLAPQFGAVYKLSSEDTELTNQILKKTRQHRGVEISEALKGAFAAITKDLDCLSSNDSFTFITEDQATYVLTRSGVDDVAELDKKVIDAIGAEKAASAGQEVRKAYNKAGNEIVDQATAEGRVINIY